MPRTAPSRTLKIQQQHQTRSGAASLRPLQAQSGRAGSKTDVSPGCLQAESNGAAAKGATPTQSCSACGVLAGTARRTNEAQAGLRSSRRECRGTRGSAVRRLAAQSGAGCGGVEGARTPCALDLPAPMPSSQAPHQGGCGGSWGRLCTGRSGAQQSS